MDEVKKDESSAGKKDVPVIGDIISDKKDSSEDKKPSFEHKHEEVHKHHEHHHHMSHHENHSSGEDMTSKLRKNPWIISTVVLAVVVLVLLIGGVGGGSANVANQDQVTQRVLDFLNTQVPEGVTYVNTTLNGGLYEILVNYQGTQVPVYVTADGENLVQGVTPFSVVEQYAELDNSTSEPVEVSIGNAPVLGDASAPVTVVEFTDFSCPFCAAASGDNGELNAMMKQNQPTWEPIVTNMIKDYVDTGKVKFVVKYSFGHSGGHPAQLVAWCLNDQNSDLFWEFYSKAFALYDQQKTTQDVEDLTKMEDLAKGLGGVDINALDTCVTSGKYDSRFDAEQAEGQSYGVQGTPAFFVNGKLISGAVPYSQMKAAIDEELANTGA